MSSKDQNLSSGSHKKYENTSDYSIGIVVSEWNSEITHAMRDAAIQTLQSHGVLEENIYIKDVPGSFELPLGARLLLGKEKIDAVICIGCVIKGETSHDEYINHAVATGIMNLGLTSGKPIVFGVLTPNDMQQAKDRAGGKYGTKGDEAAITALEMVALSKDTKLSKKSIGFS